MNIELINLREARCNYADACDFMTTSCIKCRCKPSYIDAIPLLKSSSNKFHGMGKWDEEVCARQKLVICFRNTNSYWEEGNEYEKIATLQLSQLNKPTEAFNSICNAHNCFNTAKDYPDSIKRLTKIMHEFKIKNGEVYCERIMKIAFDCIIQTFHIMMIDKESSHDFIYKAVDQYIDILVQGDNIDTVMETARQMIKIIESDGDDKKQLMHYYGYILIGDIILDRNEEFKHTLKKAKEKKEKERLDDMGIMRIIEEMDKQIEGMNINEKSMNNKINELCLYYPMSIGKILKQRIKKIKSDEESNELLISTQSNAQIEDEPFDYK